MMLRVERRTTVGAFLDDMGRRYGDARGLRTYVRSHPRDLAAKADLGDVEFFRRHPEMRSEPLEESVSLIPVSDRALSAFTGQRMALLDALAAGRFASTRELARHLGRDVRNVHGDLRALYGLGIVEFERGPGRRRAPRLAGDSIRIELGPDERRGPAQHRPAGWGRGEASGHALMRGPG